MKLTRRQLKNIVTETIYKGVPAEFADDHKKQMDSNNDNDDNNNSDVNNIIPNRQYYFIAVEHLYPISKYTQSIQSINLERLFSQIAPNSSAHLFENM